MRPLLVVFAMASTLLLSACNSVEHRSEAIPKKPLPPLVQKVDPQLVWVSSKGSGAGKSDAKLRLATTAQAIITADTTGVLRAQDSVSGTILWEVKTKNYISGGPTVVDNYVLVGTRDKGLQAYNIDDGSLLWQSPLSGEVLAAPKASRGMVFAHALDGSIAALNLSDGQLLWRQSLSTPPVVLRHSSSPAVADNQVFVGFANGRLMALHRLDGSQNWEREVAIPKGRSDIQRMTDIAADPVVRDGVVYVVSYQGRLAALRADSGTPLWEREMSSIAGFTVSKHALYVSDARGSILAIHRGTGKTIWEQDALQGRRLSKPEIFDNHLVMGDDDGYLHWLSMEDGALLNRVMVDSKGIEAPPVSMHNALYVLGRGGKVAAFKLGSKL